MRVPLLAKAPEFQGIRAWINSEPLALAGLRGKVVLLDFWTYTCVNCLRALPHLRALWERYRQTPLVLVGVHTPEFDFERDVGNVRAAVDRLGLSYPVAVDSDNATWKAYGNQYWPRQTIVSTKGWVLWEHAGEGGYAEMETVVREALAAAGAELPPFLANTQEPTFVGGISPETYAGYARNRGLGNREACTPGGCTTFVDPGGHRFNTIYLQGMWRQEREFIRQEGSGGTVSFRYRAREVNAVLRCTRGGKARVIVTLDGAFVPAERAGRDVHYDGRTSFLLVDRPDMYNVIRGPAVEDHDVRLEANSPELELYVFTFG